MLAGKALDDDFYGVEFQAGKGYDFSTTSVFSFLWQHGGDARGSGRPQVFV